MEIRSSCIAWLVSSDFWKKPFCAFSSVSSALCLNTSNINWTERSKWPKGWNHFSISCCRLSLDKVSQCLRAGKSKSQMLPGTELFCAIAVSNSTFFVSCPTWPLIDCNSPIRFCIFFNTEDSWDWSIWGRFDSLSRRVCWRSSSFNTSSLISLRVVYVRIYKMESMATRLFQSEPCFRWKEYCWNSFSRRRKARTFSFSGCS